MQGKEPTIKKNAALRACRLCASDEVYVIKRHKRQESESYRVICADCGARTTECITQEEAVNEWNHVKSRAKSIYGLAQTLGTTVEKLATRE